MLQNPTVSLTVKKNWAQEVAFLDWVGLRWHGGGHWDRQENVSRGPSHVPDLTALCPHRAAYRNPLGKWNCQKQQN